jgi:hypothetical protein
MMVFKKNLLAAVLLTSCINVSAEAVELCYRNQFAATFWVKDKDDNDNIVNGLNDGLLGMEKCANVQPGHTYKFEYYGLGTEGGGIVEKTACYMQIPDPKTHKGFHKTYVYLKPNPQFILDAMCEIWDERDWGATKRNGTELPPE